MITYRDIELLKRGDEICNTSGEPVAQVIANDNGLLSLYFFKSGEFCDRDYRQNAKNGDKVRVAH